MLYLCLLLILFILQRKLLFTEGHCLAHAHLVCESHSDPQAPLSSTGGTWARKYCWLKSNTGILLEPSSSQQTSKPPIPVRCHPLP